MDTAAFDWDLDANGNIALCPVVGWQLALMAEIAVGLQIEFVRSDEQLTRGEHERIQLVLTPPQAAELAQFLQKKVEQAMVRPSEKEN